MPCRCRLTSVVEDFALADPSRRPTCIVENRLDLEAGGIQHIELRGRLLTECGDPGSVWTPERRRHDERVAASHRPGTRRQHPHRHRQDSIDAFWSRQVGDTPGGPFEEHDLFTVGTGEIGSDAGTLHPHAVRNPRFHRATIRAAPKTRSTKSHRHCDPCDLPSHDYSPRRDDAPSASGHASPIATLRDLKGPRKAGSNDWCPLLRNAALRVR